MTAFVQQHHSNSSSSFNVESGDELEGPPLLSEYARELLLNRSQEDILPPQHQQQQQQQQQQLMTPASTNGLIHLHNHHPTTATTATRTRIRRFGKGLGPPKRAAPRASEQQQQQQEQQQQQVDEIDENIDNNNNNNNESYTKLYSKNKSTSSILTPLSPNRIIHKSPIIPPLVLPPTTTTKKNKNSITVNGKTYTKLQVMGKGGSSKVFKVQSNNGNKIFALKRITLSQEINVDSFKGEINLLHKLRQVDKVIKLQDFEITGNHIYMVMECGEIDFAHMLHGKLDEPLDLNFVRYYGTEMIKCVEAVHNHGIIHADLKPANFLLVRGKLKIIDFGIADAVSDFTVNVYRDTIMGTLNYMAPEALMTCSSGEDMKIGKPSDIWSCGCILYQMIYSRPPYDSYSLPDRIKAITNPDQKIDYPQTGIGKVTVPRSAIKLIQSCLVHNIEKRATIKDILNGDFFSPQPPLNKTVLKRLVENGIQYGAQHGNVDEQTLDLMMQRILQKLGV